MNLLPRTWEISDFSQDEVYYRHIISDLCLKIMSSGVTTFFLPFP